MKPTMGSLFAGIGGFDLGFERAGFETKWQVEIDPFCQKVLAKNFPHAMRHGDITKVSGETLGYVDVICGGFPCQDISNAGLRAGIDGERSGLWSEYARIIGELRPKFVLVENVAALLGRGIGRVLGDLASLGYDAEWEILSAADMGAPHRRERVWILAYDDGYGCHDDRSGKGRSQRSSFSPVVPLSKFWSNSSERSYKRAGQTKESWVAVESGNDVANSESESKRALLVGNESTLPLFEFCGEDVGNTASLRQSGSGQFGERSSQETHGEGETNIPLAERFRDFWAVEPNVGRVAHGVPRRVDRLKGLGNAVVPQIPEMYAHAIRAALGAA